MTSSEVIFKFGAANAAISTCRGLVTGFELRLGVRMIHSRVVVCAVSCRFAAPSGERLC